MRWDENPALCSVPRGPNLSWWCWSSLRCKKPLSWSCVRRHLSTNQCVLAPVCLSGRLISGADNANGTGRTLMLRMRRDVMFAAGVVRAPHS